MFQLIASFFGKWFVNFWNFCQWVCTALANLARHTWFILVAIGTFIYGIAVNIYNAILQAVELGQSAIQSAGTGPSAPSHGLSNMLAVANAIFPLTELMGFVIVLTSCSLALTAYRAIKGWIPTVGN